MSTVEPDETERGRQTKDPSIKALIDCCCVLDRLESRQIRAVIGFLNDRYGEHECHRVPHANGSTSA